MPIELTMPALSPTMEQGTLATWLVDEGATIEAGDVLAEIETDKATMELEAVDQGQISKIIVPAGSEDVAVGTVIALIAQEGEGAADPPIQELKTETPPADVVLSEPASSVQATAAPESDRLSAVPVIGSRVNATPLARRIASIKQISLDGIEGSGPRGKIVKADLGIGALVRSAAQAEQASAQIVTPAPAPPPEGVPVETVKLSSMRKTIARRLTESKSTVPHFYLTARCNLDPLLNLRSELNKSLEEQGVKLSVNDMLIKALALALIKVPETNVQFGGDVLHRFERVDVSMAVAIDGGLITPVIRDVGAKSLSAVARESKALASRALDGELAPEDYGGGTVSLSNLGMFGIDDMFPVINPPQALILGTAAGIRQPWVVDGEIQAATVMAATASFDHRAIDGAVAAEFMQSFRELIETPIRILA